MVRWRLRKPTVLKWTNHEGRNHPQRSGYAEREQEPVWASWPLPIGRPMPTLQKSHKLLKIEPMIFQLPFFPLFFPFQKYGNWWIMSLEQLAFIVLLNWGEVLTCVVNMDSIENEFLNHSFKLLHVAPGDWLIKSTDQPEQLAPEKFILGIC